MRRSRSFLGLLIGLPIAVGACSRIIGISEYEIDPDLDEHASSGGGSRLTDAGAPASGDAGESGRTRGGETTGGSSSGGDTSGGDSGGAINGGATSTAAGAPAGCESAADCDDDIVCTVDVCLPSGKCRNTADDSACDAMKCQTCQAGVGCVAGPTDDLDLLTDPGFDGKNEDWVETSDTFADQNIFASAQAQTPPNIAKFGPAVSGAEEQEYADLLQYVVIPERAVSITLSGYYKVAPGLTLPGDDYTVAAFYELGATSPTAEFHSWPGDEAQAAWKAFSYDVSRAEVAEMAGREYSFDLVAYSWESVFQFDSLRMTARVCEAQ